MRERFTKKNPKKTWLRRESVIGYGSGCFSREWPWGPVEHKRALLDTISGVELFVDVRAAYTAITAATFGPWSDTAPQDKALPAGSSQTYVFLDRQSQTTNFNKRK